MVQLVEIDGDHGLYGVKALFFDMFGTVLDWRTGVARSAEAILKPRGYSLDWLAFADAWRAQYQPGMEEVRSGRIPYTKLDVLHRRMFRSWPIATNPKAQNLRSVLMQSGHLWTSGLGRICSE